MQRYIIFGADRETGVDTVFKCDCETEEHTRAVASRLGVLVTEIRQDTEETENRKQLRENTNAFSDNWDGLISIYCLTMGLKPSPFRRNLQEDRQLCYTVGYGKLSDE